MAEIENWREQDAHDSYFEAIAEIGRRVRAGEEKPRHGAHFQRVNWASDPAAAAAASEQHAAPAEGISFLASMPLVVGKIPCLR
jgi:hypothetical protein